MSVQGIYRVISRLDSGGYDIAFIDPAVHEAVPVIEAEEVASRGRLVHCASTNASVSSENLYIYSLNW